MATSNTTKNMITKPKTLAATTAFDQDVKTGLTSKPKFLLSKYFYDAAGDRLFQKIMDLPEYYLTRSEGEILDSYSETLGHYVAGKKFDLIELGAGDGLKTRILLQHFENQQLKYQYFPVDISGNILVHLKKELNALWPNIAVIPLEGDYFTALDQMKQTEAGTTKLVLFLGSTIGNMSFTESTKFLQQLRQRLEPGDLVLVGFDLKKNPDQILAAYSDAAGVTRDFNFNHLLRINRELGANFDIANFQHWPVYHPISGEMKSYLVSKIAHSVFISKIELTVTFSAWEAIDMELSKKFDFEEIEELATLANLKVLNHFTDQQNYFSDTLFLVQ
jgi:dimethylhistidine N-methyltransferase